ncbi:MAG: aspartate-semialdehyde dehydrogenase [Moorella sp. (in: firmicutes)]|jgi:aspartate-semialdehyde dehydrogenase|uniref:aspartate-semialdehyde dehydrogenase n=1 Tax=unclassified Neomoorella TaxID=2676739 RepID=UPI0010FFAF6C|nr:MULTISPECIES: aspartate-semialdehyde dehydrogenase [unclassified Moorella (in: firmicutes)]MDK2815458.1 aspartate-semialdehyde dehydrogenase [Moorella sp. (in: firmicutes)]MDK2894063.1 aspartate-semialdehyde dehydrogenase [Moorella sp. (in: firmicutes)]GEA15272.1 aspartate-semialdehyde dehydrogenase [Moorella sp. E308F]GEA19867.1 aspartate-semialdehyde dehydrogenase [Moorella sp. E306M]
MKTYNVAVVGTGAVGQTMLKVLEERNFPVGQLKVLATSRSAGKTVTFRGEEYVVEETTPASFAGIDVALFAGGEASRIYGRAAVEAGAVVIDNSNNFRMDPEVPLVVPEVNPQDVRWHKGLIANPNCSTIQMVVALKPIYDAAGIKRIVVSTYQAVSGAGQEAIDELRQQSRQVLAGEEVTGKVFPWQIAFNCLPHIDVFLENGYSKEEMKMVNETKKIMGDDQIQVTATTVRVPVFNGHSEAINVETREKLTAAAARELLRRAPGVVVVDDLEAKAYPLAIQADGRDEVFVGRIREDFTIANGLNMWVVADNLRKGAATNAVQIAELLVQEGLL